MTAPLFRPVVAVFNSDSGMLARLRVALDAAGFRAVTAQLREFTTDHALLAFLVASTAGAIVYDIARPVEDTLPVFTRLYEATSALQYPLVVTTPRPADLDGRVGDVAVAELGAGGGTLDGVVEAVRYALRSRRA